MAATRQDLEQWFYEGVKYDQKYMVVVCDTFDYEDYPCYFETKTMAAEKVANPGDMQRVMEVYDLNADKDLQMKMHRAWML